MSITSSLSNNIATSLAGEGLVAKGMSFVIEKLITQLIRFVIFLVVLIIIVKIIGFFIPKRYKQAFITDVADLLLSFADELLYLIVGPLANVLEIGDWIAGIWRFFSKEKKVLGLWWGLFLMWLIFGCPPLNFIPVFGEALGWILNFIPCAMILRFLFNKFRKADKLTKETSGLVGAARIFEIKDADKAAKKLAEAEQLIGEENPVAAVHELNSFNKKLKADLKKEITAIYDNLERIAEDEDNQARTQIQTILAQEEKLSADAQNTVLMPTERSIDDITKFEEHFNAVLNEVNPLIKKAKSGRLKADEYLRLSELLTQLKEIEDAFAQDFNVDEEEIFGKKAA